MFVSTKHLRRIGTLAFVLAATLPALAQSSADRFHKAYYLETAQGDYAAAAKLYSEVVADKSADAQIVAQAKTRLAGCREELATTDLARLMPNDPIAYIELSRPGQQVERLLRQLGLLADGSAPAAESGKRFAISPALTRALLDLRGAAVAITGFDPHEEAPTGVAVLHPGNVDALRGLIETALPAAADPVAPIEGFATYCIEKQVYATLTSRLVIVASQPELIEDVIERLKDSKAPSLATNEALSNVLKERQDALLFFCVNPQPIMPLIQAGIAAAGTQSQEAALAQALLDVKSLRSISGRLGVAEDGLFLDVGLRLAAEHRNLVFNLLRLPPVSPRTLKSIPSGAAAFAAGALNEENSRFSPAPQVESGGRAVVTLLDIGREVFANVIGYAVFVLPPEGSGSRSGPPIPDVAAVFSVHDPARSEALWTEFLGIASTASGRGGLEGSRMDIEGVPVRRFDLPEKVSLYYATVDKDVIIAPTQSAMTRTLAARRSGKSILDDAGVSRGVSAIGGDTVLALYAHAGRCLEVARQFMSAHELQEIEEVAPLLQQTSAVVTIDHSNELWRLAARVNGIPKIDKLIARELNERGQFAGASVRRVAAAQANVQREFERLAADPQHAEAARALIERVEAAIREDAMALNNLAWELLTEKQYGGRFNEAALRWAQLANEQTNFSNWMFVDTLAWAKFRAGDVAEAIRLEKKAIELCKDTSRMGELTSSLETFQKGAAREQ